MSGKSVLCVMMAAGILASGVIVQAGVVTPTVQSKGVFANLTASEQSAGEDGLPSRTKGAIYDNP